MSQQTISHIKEVLEKDIKPLLAMHLGSLEFISFINGIVTIRFEGTCKGCPLSQLTLKSGIESILKQKVPEVQSVEAAA